MCRTPALAVTVLALLGTSAMAAGPAKPGKGAPVAATAPAARAKASPAQRAEAARLDPLARAAFWAAEAEIDGRDIDALVGMAQALRQLGRGDEAADAAGRALVMAPDNIDALLESARAQIARGQGFYAIAPAQRAATLAPRDWRPAALLGVAMEQAQRDDEALTWHQRALALAPNEPSAISNLAMYHASHGSLPKAEQMLRVAAASPGADARVRQNLALVIGLQGRIGEAEALARRDLPPEQVANNLAWLRAATERQPTGAARSWDAMRAGGS